MILQLTSLLGKPLLLLLLLGELAVTQVVQAQVTCRAGVGRIVTLAGTTQLQSVAQAWANGFRTFCNETSNRYNITPSGNGGSTTAFGVNRLCGVGSGSVDIALVVDELLPPTEVIEIGDIAPVDLFQSKCVKGVLSRTLIKLQVASNRVVIALPAKTPVAQCIQKLGGLTRGQLRWMFSNYTLTQLLKRGLSPKEVPNSDRNDSTRRWRELSADCPDVEIRQTKSIDSDVNDFFFSRILSNQSNGEVIRPTPTLDINSLPFIPNAISIVDFATYSARLSPSQRADLYLVPLEESAAGLDPLTFHVSLLVRSDDVSLLVDGSLPFATFAYSNLGTQQVVANGLVPGNAASNAKNIGASYGMHPSSATATCKGPVTSTNVSIVGDSLTTDLVANGWRAMYHNLFSAANIVTSKTSSTDGADKVCLGKADIADMNRVFDLSEIILPRREPTVVCNTTGAYLHQVTVAKTTGRQSLFMNLLWSTRGKTIPFVCCGFSPAGRDVVHGARLTQVATPSLCTVPSS